MCRFLACALLLVVVSSGCAAGESGSPATVSESAAEVGGRVASNVGGPVEYWVQYGRTTAYGSETEHKAIETEKNVPVDVVVAIPGLERSTTYHYRLCAQDSQQQGGPGCGEDRTVTTQSFACGETVSADVRLTGNVSCPDGVGTPGLVVGAAGIDINLAGHALRGQVFVGGGTGAGIDNSAGFDDVTIRNGSLSLWGAGIRLAGASRNQIRHVRAAGSPYGIEIDGGDANEVRGSGAFGRVTGIVVSGSNGLVIANASASGGFDSGVVLDADQTRVLRNEVTAGEQNGIELQGSGNRLAANRIDGRSTTFDGNLVIRSGSDNVLVDNEVLGGALFDPNEPSGPQGDGIFVSVPTAGTVLRGNSAHDNDGDGIEIQSADTRLRDNRATDNADFGIDAAPGVTDLGGNTASGNGNPLQCRNVFCG
jgi:parallel beta-helix repeat protein